MDELISRQQAIDAFTTVGSIFVYGEDVCKAIVSRLKLLPPAQSDIIRCKDCKHRYMEDMIWHCPFGLMGGENFFCGYGSLEAVEMRGDIDGCNTE